MSVLTLIRGAAEPEVPFADTYVGKIAARGAQHYPAAVPRASPLDARPAGLWAHGILLRARLVIVGVPPILARLPHVSFSIQETIGARAGRPRSDRVVALLTPVAPEHRALGARRPPSPGGPAGGRAG